MLFFIQSDVRGLFSEKLIESSLIHILISRVRRLSYADCTAVAWPSIAVEMGGIYKLHTKLIPARNKVQNPRLTLLGIENVCERPATGDKVGRP